MLPGRMLFCWTTRTEVRHYMGGLRKSRRNIRPPKSIWWAFWSMSVVAGAFCQWTYSDGDVPRADRCCSRQPRRPAAGFVCHSPCRAKTEACEACTSLGAAIVRVQWSPYLLSIDIIDRLEPCRYSVFTPSPHNGSVLIGRLPITEGIQCTPQYKRKLANNCDALSLSPSLCVFHY